MPHLTAINFPDETVARQAADELVRGAEELLLDPDAMGIIICEGDGNFQLVSSRRPGGKGAWGRFWGVLFEALTDPTDSGGLDPEFRNQLKGLMSPGTSTLLVVSSHTKSLRILDAISQFEGASLSCSLSGHTMPELWVSLGGEHSRI